MSLFGLGKKSPTKDILILDIGSASAAVGIATLDKSGPPVLRAQTRIETPIDSTRDSAKLGDNTLRAAQQALEDVLAANAPTPAAADVKENPASLPPAPQPKPFVLGPQAKTISHAAVFLPAPWSNLSLYTLNSSSEQPVKVNADMLQRMIASYLQKEHPDQPGQEIIERSALGLRLNGYPVEDIPKNATASTIEMTAVSVLANVQLLTALRDLVRNYLGHTATISFHSTNISLAYGLSVMMPEEGDYLLCNNEGELAELLLVDEHTPLGSATAPQGCSTILRTLNVHADMARAESASALALAKDETSPMQEKMSQTLAAAQKTCAEGFQGAASELVQHFGAPAKIYIIGNGPEALWYADAIAGAPFLKTLFPGGIAVQSVSYAAAAKFLNPASALPRTLPSLTGKADAASGAGRGGDIFLALEAIFCDSRFDRDRTFNFNLK